MWTEPTLNPFWNNKIWWVARFFPTLPRPRVLFCALLTSRCLCKHSTCIFCVTLYIGETVSTPHPLNEHSRGSPICFPATYLFSYASAQKGPVSAVSKK